MGQGACRAQSHHPPLYYLLGAAATFWIDTGRDVCYEPPTNPFWNYRYWEVGVDNKNQYLHGPPERFPWPAELLAARLMRAVNILLGAVTVWLTWAIGRAVWPGRPALALGGAAFVAFNPMFVYLSGAVNNDIIAAAAGGALLLASVRLLRADGPLLLSRPARLWPAHLLRPEPVVDGFSKQLRGVTRACPEQRRRRTRGVSRRKAEEELCF
jgi:hypothetical protein